MPEFPDITVYIEALEPRVVGQKLQHLQLGSPFVLRTAAPPIESVHGRTVTELRRLGKRICFGLDGDLWLVLHLMIAGRLHWHETKLQSSGKARKSTAKSARPKLSRSPKNPGLAAFQFPSGLLTLTEAGSQRRASLHLVEGQAGLDALDPGGLEIFESDLATFARVLTAANHTLKRALTDPRLFSGIGNAYSDEILFQAQLSPVALTQRLAPEQIERLFQTIRSTLTDWVERLRAEIIPSDSSSSTGIGFPEKVTAFRDDMAVHGRYKQPCLRCGTRIQRIRYAANETNYCPHCQTGGKLLADRSLSRLLRADWPRTAEELEGLTSKR